MKFLFVTPESNSLFQHWVGLCDVQGTPEPFHLLSILYSKHHNQLPKSDDPNISFSTRETLFEACEKFYLSVSSLAHLCSEMVDTQHECEHDPYLQHLSKYEHFHYHISERSSLSFVFVDLLVIQDNDTSLPKPNELSFDLHYGSFFDIQPYCKSKTFIETKVAAMKLQGFNH